MEQAKNDPKFQRVLALNQEMAEMERYLLDFKQEIEQAMAEAEAEAEAPDAPGLSTEGEKLQAQYAELMKLLGNQPVQPAPKADKPKPKTAEKRRRELKLKFADADQIMAAYKTKSAEMQAARPATRLCMCPQGARHHQRERREADLVGVQLLRLLSSPTLRVC